MKSTPSTILKSPGCVLSKQRRKYWLKKMCWHDVTHSLYFLAYFLLAWFSLPACLISCLKSQLIQQQPNFWSQNIYREHYVNWKKKRTHSFVIEMQPLPVFESNLFIILKYLKWCGTGLKIMSTTLSYCSVFLDLDLLPQWTELCELCPPIIGQWDFFYRFGNAENIKTMLDIFLWIA